MNKYITLIGLVGLTAIAIFVFLPAQNALASCPTKTIVTGTTANLVGQVTNTGGDPNLTVWFVYGTTSNALSTPTTPQSMYGTGSFCSFIYSLTPCQQYFYQAVAQNGIGTSYGDVNSFTVACNPVSVDIKANNQDGPITVGYGSNVNLSWTSANAVSCQAYGDWSGSKATSGTQSINVNILKNYTFGLTCVDSTGTQNSTDSVSVTVSAVAPTVITLAAIVTL